ncbi:MAG TPA: hypothetical protein VFT18_06775 [Gaiellaceae bacterium]|nr:hypothetical protein [Gaiellaceae bacterium]
MARNKRQTFGKLQRERQRAEKRERKQEKKEAKKAAAEAGLIFDPETGEYIDPAETLDDSETLVTPSGEDSD